MSLFASLVRWLSRRELVKLVTFERIYHDTFGIERLPGERADDYAVRARKIVARRVVEQSPLNPGSGE